MLSNIEHNDMVLSFHKMIFSGAEVNGYWDIVSR